MHMRQYFWLNREILQNKHFQFFDWSKTRHDRAKTGLAGQLDRPPFKNYFEAWKVSSKFNNKAKQDFLVAQNRHATTTYGNLVKLLNKVAVNHFAVTLMRLNAGHACINPESNSLTFSHACL